MAEHFQRYLGDGVYVSYDGYQMWLAANHHENKVIAIDDSVWQALVQYREHLYTELLRKQETLNAVRAEMGASELPTK